MKLKLTDGKYTLGAYLAPLELEELDELLQRVLMKLKVQRGTFLPLPDYGSRLYQLSRTKPSNRETAARQYVLEALADETELELSALELLQKADGEATLLLTFTYKSEYTVTVETEI
ncbi:MAG: hypothetical protein CVU91_08780 [Firmicutes bacterium HGW-Firmicutes-16]|nr:MAG: hypothetical protein CVU91_08780 [Firmicutes bacterium HGW-Firmicutes-16]